jgi:ABC-type branched-subunit amino acid transport system ATPase component
VSVAPGIDHADTPVLEVREVSVRFGGLSALDRVSLTLARRSLVGLVGPNGAGKSTLFAVCSGLLRPAAGKVLVSGRDVTGSSPQIRARRGLARTFQHPEMFTSLTVRQHLVLAHRVRHSRSCLWKDMFTAASLRKPGSEEVDRVQSILELLSLTSVAESVVDVLPLGTTRLVEVGRALASGPNVMLLDEPLSGLDVNEASRLTDALERIVYGEGISLLLVEHDVASVLRVCRDIFVLDFGQLIAQGSPDSVRNNPAVKAAYLGEDTGSDGGEGAGSPAVPVES